jgi:serine/threonine protein kinase
MVTEERPPDGPGFRPGSVLAGYRVEEQVGQGGMAVVYRARDEQLRRAVALKVLAPALASDGAFRRRFIRESLASAAVEDPHIIPVYAAGEADGVLYIAMRFVSGGDLRQVLDRGGALDPGRAMEIISAVAAALDAAHGAGLVHRDVKPGNILVDTGAGRPDHVYLSDFGISKALFNTVTMAGMSQAATTGFIGTVGYSAPEQLREDPTVDGRADQYSLACVAYELLTGGRPFLGSAMMAVVLAHIQEPPPPLTSRDPELPAAADPVMAQALAKNAGDRYQSCSDFADALREALGLPAYRGSGRFDAYGAVVAPGPSSQAPRSFPTPGPGLPPDQGHPPTQITESPPLQDLTRPDLPVDGQAAMPAWWRATQGIELPSGSGTLAGGAPPSTDHRPAPTEAVPVTEAVPESETRPGADADVSGPQVADVPGVLVPDMTQALFTEAVVAPVTVAPVKEAPGGTPVKDWRRRLPVIAVVGAVVGAAAVVPFLMTSSPGTGKPGATGTRAGSPSAATSASGPAASKPVAVGTPAQLGLPASVAGDAGVISSLAFSPSGTALAIADTGKVCLWTLAAHACGTEFTSALQVAFSPDGTILVTGNDTNASGTPDGTIRRWDLKTRQLISPALADPDSMGALSVSCSPDDKTLAAGDANGTTYLWDVTTGRSTGKFTDPVTSSVKRGVNAVAFGPGGTTLAVADQNGSVYLWNVATGKMTAPLAGADGSSVITVTFSSDGTMLAAGTADGTSYLWRRSGANWRLADRFAVPSAPVMTDPAVRTVAFSADGTLLAVGDSDGTTDLRGTATGKLENSLTDTGGGGVATAAFSPDGATLATGDYRGHVYLWPLS